MVLTSGSIEEAVWLVDCSGVRVPILAHKFGADGSLVLEGCEDCKLGLLVNLANQPGGKKTYAKEVQIDLRTGR